MGSWFTTRLRLKKRYEESEDEVGKETGVLQTVKQVVASKSWQVRTRACYSHAEARFARRDAALTPAASHPRAECHGRSSNDGRRGVDSDCFSGAHKHICTSRLPPVMSGTKVYPIVLVYRQWLAVLRERRRLCVLLNAVVVFRKSASSNDERLLAAASDCYSDGRRHGRGPLVADCALRLSLPV